MIVVDTKKRLSAQQVLDHPAFIYNDGKRMFTPQEKERARSSNQQSALKED